jgi:hypothetical protein
MLKYVQYIPIMFSICLTHVTHPNNYSILNKIFYNTKTLFD